MSGRRSRFGLSVDGRVKCLACSRGCTLSEGQVGLCGNYANFEGELKLISYGYLSAVESRPIEVKPFYHYWPGTTALTFSGWGCNFLCPWCQNWHLSKERFRDGLGIHLDPEELARMAVREGDEGLCASFNEPAVTIDYVIDAFEEGFRRGLYCCVVTNGYFTRESLKALMNAGCDGFSIDIKGCPETYRRFIGAADGAEVVLRNAEEVINEGGHVEMVYLVVTGANDWVECYEWVLRSVKERLGTDVPLHINRYYPAYRYSKPSTSVEKLLRIKGRARELGFKYVYVGNVWGPEYLDLITTYCPKCGEALIIRSWHGVTALNLRNGECPSCGFRIPLKGTPKTCE